VNISRVEPQTLDFVWSALRPQILKALSLGAGEHYTEPYYFDAVKSGAMAMWVGHEAEHIVAGGILSVQQHPKHKTVFVELLAGERLDAWLPQVETLLKEFKGLVGATTIEASCRPGLAKKLAGWKTKAILMELE
jgi:hypothetical protein